MERTIAHARFSRAVLIALSIHAEVQSSCSAVAGSQCGGMDGLHRVE
jgi:hypothetical protein